MLASGQNLFHLPGPSYFLNHSMGAQPVRTEALCQEVLTSWRTKGSEAWKDWLQVTEDFSLALSNLLGGKAQEYCAQTNVSAGVSKVLFSLPQDSRRTKVLCSDVDFPSQGFALEQAKKRGWHLEILTSHNHQVTTEQWQKALTDDVALAFFTHSQYGDSRLNPIAEWAQLARKRGIFTIVDVAQSAGVVPFSMPDFGVDCVVGSCVKWLCGGAGAGFVWLDENGMKNLEPQDVGWFSHENPMEFDIHAFRYHSSALRFWGGTPSILPFACATAGLKLLNEIGMSTIRKTNLDLKNQLRRGLTSLGLKVLTPLAEQEQGGTLTVMFENPAGVVQRLMKRQISADWRPHYGVRFSPHVYNTPQDVETVVQALTEEHDTNYGTTQKNHPL